MWDSSAELCAPPAPMEHLGTGLQVTNPPRPVSLGCGVATGSPCPHVPPAPTGHLEHRVAPGGSVPHPSPMGVTGARGDIVQSHPHIPPLPMEPFGHGAAAGSPKRVLGHQMLASMARGQLS